MARQKKNQEKPIGAMSDTERLQGYQKEMDALTQKWGFGIKIEAFIKSAGEMSNGDTNITLGKRPVISPLADWQKPPVPRGYKPPADDNADDSPKATNGKTASKSAPKVVK